MPIPMVGIGWNIHCLFLVDFIALLIRWLRLGCRLPRNEHDQFDPNYQQAFEMKFWLRS